MPEHSDTAVVMYSFGGDIWFKKGNRYGPANEKLIYIAILAKEPNEFLLVQDVGELCKLFIPPDLAVCEHRISGEFPGTEEITFQYADYLRANRVTKVKLVAHPFLHVIKCRQLLQAEGFEVEVVPTGWVPFDRKCPAWWCRGPLHILWYAVLQKLFGRQGK